MSQTSLLALNLCQNREDFELKPLKDQTPLFKFKYLEKTLDPIKDNPQDPKKTIKQLLLNV